MKQDELQKTFDLELEVEELEEKIAPMGEGSGLQITCT